MTVHHCAQDDCGATYDDRMIPAELDAEGKWWCSRHHVVKLVIVLDVNQSGACVQGVFHVRTSATPDGDEDPDEALEKDVREQHWDPVNPIVPLDRSGAVRLMGEIAAGIKFHDELVKEDGTAHKV